MRVRSTFSVDSFQAFNMGNKEGIPWFWYRVV